MIVSLVSSPVTAAEANNKILPSEPLVDFAKAIAVEVRKSVNQQLKDIETNTGWRFKILVAYNQRYKGREGNGQYDEEVKQIWRPDSKTVVLGVDPSAPNVFEVRHLGFDISRKLRRDFWVEIQGRYGNLFYIKEQGIEKALRSVIEASEQCLNMPDGCLRVPGLSEEQYTFTLLCSVAGALILGAASTIQPQGSTKQNYDGIAIFSPLWGILFIQFGLGPILSRDLSQKQLIAQNILAFIVVAILINKLFRIKSRENKLDN